MLRLGCPRRVKIRGYHTVCGCGGIGRRARFRFLWGQLREGSSPFTRTKKTRGRKTSGFFVGEDLNLVPSEQVPRRLGNMVARGRSACSASRSPYFLRARRRKPSTGRFSPCLPFTRTKKTRGRKTSGFFVGEDLNLVPSEQVPRRLGNMVARGRSACSASRSPYFLRARRRKPSTGRFSPCLPFTRTKKTRGRKTSGFFVGEDFSFTLCFPYQNTSSNNFQLSEVISSL